MKCRFCGKPVALPFIDLVNAPPSNAYLTEAQLNEPEAYFPLKVFVCENCWLVQVDEYKKSDEIFDARYAYFSSFSSSWLAHSRRYVERITKRLGLTGDSFVVELASNDGYLLQYFNEARIPCLGVEPTASTAAAAREKGVETVEVFWGLKTAGDIASERGKADLILGNNVLAHVPDINDFVAGIQAGLKPSGTVTMEFPHLLNLIQYNQFDTIYHEHFSYLSFGAVERVFAAHGLTLYDVEELPTHGGSLRVYGRHSDNAALPVAPAVAEMKAKEERFGLYSRNAYEDFQEKADTVKREFLAFLLERKRAGKTVAAYGAAAKGNTLLNYCGVKGADLLAYVVDRSPHKQGLYLPGSHIPVVPEERLRETRPDVIVILPWNIRKEIAAQLEYAREWNARFAVAIPHLETFR